LVSSESHRVILMMDLRAAIAAVALLGALASSSSPALAQATDTTPVDLGPLPPRVRIVVNAAYWTGSGPTFRDTRQFEEYVEQTTIRTSYATQSGAFGPDASLQVSVFRGLGILVGYTQVSRDQTGTVDVTRPNPLYFDRPRQASAEIDDYRYRERAFHLDLAYGRSAGRQFDWSLFAGVSLFRVEADLLDSPVYDDVYPYDELRIQSTPGKRARSSPTGFNLGGRLDYRFGGSGRFAVGVQFLYSTARVELQASPEAEKASFDAGGFQVGAGVRLYF
jgi:hypothetical protein